MFCDTLVEQHCDQIFSLVAQLLAVSHLLFGLLAIMMHRRVPTYAVEVPFIVADEVQTTWVQPPIRMNVAALGDEVEDVFADILEVRRVREEIVRSCESLNKIEVGNSKVFQQLPLWMTIPYIKALPKEVYNLVAHFALPPGARHLFRRVYVPTRLYVHVSPFLAPNVDAVLDEVNDRMGQDVELLRHVVQTLLNRNSFFHRCCEMISYLQQRPDVVPASRDALLQACFLRMRQL